MFLSQILEANGSAWCYSYNEGLQSEVIMGKGVEESGEDRNSWSVSTSFNPSISDQISESQMEGEQLQGSNSRASHTDWYHCH